MICTDDVKNINNITLHTTRKFLKGKENTNQNKTNKTTCVQ